MVLCLKDIRLLDVNVPREAISGVWGFEQQLLGSQEEMMRHCKAPGYFLEIWMLLAWNNPQL